MPDWRRRMEVCVFGGGFGPLAVGGGDAVRWARIF